MATVLPGQSAVIKVSPGFHLDVTTTGVAALRDEANGHFGREIRNRSFAYGPAAVGGVGDMLTLRATAGNATWKLRPHNVHNWPPFGDADSKVAVEPGAYCGVGWSPVPAGSQTVKPAKRVLVLSSLLTALSHVDDPDRYHAFYDPSNGRPVFWDGDEWVHAVDAAATWHGDHWN